MGDSRSWGYDMEDTTKTCKHGKITKYFDVCQCSGCVADREHSARVSAKADMVRKIALEVYSSIPESQWHKITTINIRELENESLQPYDYF